MNGRYWTSLFLALGFYYLGWIRIMHMGWWSSGLQAMDRVEKKRVGDPLGQCRAFNELLFMHVIRIHGCETPK